MLTGKREVLILGAGPAGLAAALGLAEEQDSRVTIIEKETAAGGLCRTFEKDGCRLDYGPHIIHTTRPDILHFLQKILGADLQEQETKVKIYFNGKFVPYPIRGFKVLTSLSFFTALRACADYLSARFLLTLRDPADDQSFKSWITNRFGRTLYNIYFGPYAQKAWKIPDDQISAYVARKRVPVVSLIDYIRSFIKLKPKNFHPEDPSTIRAYYPKYGVGQVTDFLERSVCQSSQSLITGSRAVRVKINGKKVESVTYERDNGLVSLPCDFLFSSIPLNEFISILDPAPQENVRAAAAGIDYCAERLLYIVADKKEVFDCGFLYFQDPKVRFNRVYLPKKHGPFCVPENKEVLCVEFTCSVGDDIWNVSDKELFEETIGVFQNLGLLKAREVSDFFSRYVTHAYPRFRTGFEKKLQTVFDFLETLENCVVLGRQGLFCYANLDEVLHMGFGAVEFYRAMRWTGIDYKSLFESYIHINEPQEDQP